MSSHRWIHGGFRVVSWWGGAAAQGSMLYFSSLGAAPPHTTAQGGCTPPPPPNIECYRPNPLILFLELHLANVTNMDVAYKELQVKLFLSLFSLFCLAYERWWVIGQVTDLNWTSVGEVQSSSLCLQRRLAPVGMWMGCLSILLVKSDDWLSSSSGEEQEHCFCSLNKCGIIGICF
jgi:hypothetical protein